MLVSSVFTHMSSNDTDGAEHAESGAPSEGEIVADRFSTDEIFQRVLATGSEEINSPLRVLTLSGVAAGFAITLTFVADRKSVV